MTRPYLDWKLGAVMDKCKIRKPQMLKRLEEVGYLISSDQLARVIAKRPMRLNPEMLEAFLQVLECDISDLLVLEKPEESSSSTVVPMLRKRPPAF